MNTTSIRHTVRLGAAGLVLMVAVPHVALAIEPGAQSRDLFRSQMKTQFTSIVALQYEIVLLEDGKEKPILNPDEHVFSLGDQILVRIEPVEDVYIYIFQEGTSGHRSCLLPQDDETAPMAKKGETITLPDDGTAIEFGLPVGKEKLIVAATVEPSKDLAALANAVFKKDAELLTGRELEERKRLRAKNAQVLESIGKQMAAGVTYRGLLADDKTKDFVEKARERGVGSVVSPPSGDETSTFAMSVRGEGKGPASLVLTIPLNSAMGDAALIKRQDLVQR